MKYVLSLLILVLFACQNKKNLKTDEIVIKETEDGAIVISNLFSDVENVDFDVSVYASSEQEITCGMINISDNERKVVLGTTMSGCSIGYTSNDSSKMSTEAHHMLNEVVFNHDYWTQLKPLVDSGAVVTEIRLKKINDQRSSIFYYQIDHSADSVLFIVNY